MKNLILKYATLLFLVFATALGYSQKLESPRDSVTGKIGKAIIWINYGSPSVKGRTIWGDLVPYDKVWRAGANEATTFTTDQALKIEGKDLPAGKYSFFIIPGKTESTVIFNKTANQWGAYEYKQGQDALRVGVKNKKSSTMQEHLAYKINKNSFSLNWEHLEVPVSVTP